MTGMLLMKSTWGGCEQRGLLNKSFGGGGRGASGGRDRGDVQLQLGFHPLTEL